MNPSEQTNVIRLNDVTEPIKIEALLYAMNEPYAELTGDQFPDYIQKIEDLLVYDEQEKLSHGVLVARFPCNYGTVVYRNAKHQLVMQSVDNIQNLNIQHGDEGVPSMFLVPKKRRVQGRPRRNNLDR